MATKITYISRLDYDDHHTHCWRVSIRRRGMKMTRSFTDSVWGGKDKAFAAAKRYRDEILCAVPPLTKLEYANFKRKNNTTGTAGVSRIKRGGGFSWLARLQLPDGRKLSATFPESRHGPDQAQKLAIQARQKMLKQIDGEQYFVPVHGKVLKRVGPVPSKGSRIERPRSVTVRIARYLSSKGIDALYVRVSNGSDIKTKQFRVGFHGEDVAWLLAVRTAQAWVNALGGVEAGRCFERDAAYKPGHFPVDGVSFKSVTTESIAGPRQSREAGKSASIPNTRDRLDAAANTSRTLCIRLVRYQLRPRKNSHKAGEQLHLHVADGKRKFTRTFSLNFHGEGMAFGYAKHAALEAAREIGGLDAANIFEKNYVRKLSELPAGGIRVRIPILEGSQ